MRDFLAPENKLHYSSTTASRTTENQRAFKDKPHKGKRPLNLVVRHVQADVLGGLELTPIRVAEDAAQLGKAALGLEVIGGLVARVDGVQHGGHPVGEVLGLPDAGNDLFRVAVEELGVTFLDSAG